MRLFNRLVERSPDPAEGYYTTHYTVNEVLMKISQVIDLVWAASFFAISRCYGLFWLSFSLRGREECNMQDLGGMRKPNVRAYAPVQSILSSVWAIFVHVIARKYRQLTVEL